MSSNLPSLIATSTALTPARRDLDRVNRVADRDVAVVHAKARVLAERGRANTRAIENVAIDAMQAGTQVSRHAMALASTCPVAEPMLRSIVEQTGMALGQIVGDTGRDLR